MWATHCRLHPHRSGRQIIACEVSGTWKEVQLPRIDREVNPVAYAAACMAVVTGYADSITDSERSATARQPMLQRLIGGWDHDVRCMRALARIPSLTELAAQARHILRAGEQH